VSENQKVLIAEASDLGLAPGQWPESILVGYHGEFKKVGMYTDPEGDIIDVLYVGNGPIRVLQVFND